LLAFSVNKIQRELELDGKNALIIDQLYQKGSQDDFSEKCRDLFIENGYKVRIVKGKNVTLTTLSELNWKKNIVILRTHSGIFDNGTWLFTGQEYSNTEYVIEQLAGEVNIGKCPTYDFQVFTFSSQFIRRYFEFRKSTLILMGCSGMALKDVSVSFHDKGCKTVIGWSEPILKSKTDEYMLRVIDLIVVGESVESVVDIVNQELNIESKDQKLVFSIT